jgi:diguanylate cyclase (GGDEF)-like protein
MTALLGRPASAAARSLAAGAPRGPCGARQGARWKNSRSAISRWSCKTARAAALDQIAGDPIIDTAGHFQGFRGVGSDITEIRQTQERLTNLANMDVLSGLPNRGRVRQLLGEALRQATASNVPCAIMFLDLDGFKPVNDTFGHPKGDAILQACRSDCAKVGPDGHVGRMGGDEFAIVVTDAQSRQKVEQLADRIIASIKPNPIMVDKTEIRIGVSIGCAFGPIDGAERRRPDPEGRPRALRGQGRRARHAAKYFNVGHGRPSRTIACGWSRISVPPSPLASSD